MEAKKEKEEEEILCWLCGEYYNPDIELFKKYHKGNICFNCSREMFEDDIGYDPN